MGQDGRRHYRSERSERWIGFEHRPGDVVLSTRSKCGTTWMQMVCLTLIHGTPLPAPLALLSPWIDWDVEPVDVVHGRLAEQRHRRVIKTHTPLDGLPRRADVRYIVVGRHPLDVAVSLYHHVDNLDQIRSAELRGGVPVERPDVTLDDWMAAWVHDSRSPEEELDTLAGNVHHAADAWRRRVDGNVLMVHFSELAEEREATMRRVASWLDVDVPEREWPALVEATSFEAMRARPEATVPDRLGVLKDPAAFFRSGSRGEGIRACSDELLTDYRARVATLASPDVLAWLHGSRREMDGAT